MITEEQRLKLLADIARSLQALQHTDPRAHLGCIEVKLWSWDGAACLLTTDVPTAIGYLADGIYWDEEGDWSEAGSATAQTI